MRRLIPVTLAVLAVLVTAPTSSNAQGYAFRHSDFEGPMLQLRPGEYPSLHAMGIGGDAISSFWVDEGFELMLFEHTGFNGASWTITGPAVLWSLPRTQCDWWNDRVSSIIVRHVPGTSWIPNSGRWSNRIACATKVAPAPDEPHYPRGADK